MNKVVLLEKFDAKRDEWECEKSKYMRVKSPSNIAKDLLAKRTPLQRQRLYVLEKRRGGK